MSYLPIQCLNLKKAQAVIGSTPEVRYSYIDINIGDLVADDNHVTKSSATSLTLKAGKTYFIYAVLSHNRSYMFSYDIYVDGVRANQCTILHQSNTAGKNFYPQNGMAIVAPVGSDAVITIRNLTIGNATANDTIYFDTADLSIINGAITILYY